MAIGEGKHKDGRQKLYNALKFFPADGKPNSFPWPDMLCASHGYGRTYIKTLLPNYREFEEPRHFTSSTDLNIDPDFYFRPTEICRVKVSFLICEDSWDEDYNIKPTQEYIKRGAGLIINISGSPYTEGKNKARDRVFGQGHAKGNHVPLIYVNAVGIQNNGKTIYTFDGSSVAYNSLGEPIFQVPMFEEGLYYVEYKDNDLYPISKSFTLPTGYLKP